jgi:hypothetical protein
MRSLLRKAAGALGAAYFFGLFVALSLLAPCKPAFGQGFEVASGDNSVGEPPVTYSLLGQKFSFGRNASAHASMFRTNVGGLQSVGSTLSESSQVTVFSKPTKLFSFTGTAFHNISGGVDSKSWSIFLDVPDGQQLNASGSGDIRVKPKLTGEQDVNISPTITVGHDFGNVKGFQIGVVGIDLELDVNVHVKSTVNLDWNVKYPANGADITKSLDTTSSAKVTRDVKLLKLGLAILEAELKLAGKANFDFSDTKLTLDEHPRFAALAGEVDSNITAMKLTFSGGIEFVGSVTLPVIGKKELTKFELVAFDPLSLILGAAPKVLFKK